MAVAARVRQDPSRLQAEAEALVAEVIDAARRELALDLEYRVEMPPGGASSSVAVETTDGRSLGALVAMHELPDADRRAVRSLAGVLASRLGRSGLAERRVEHQLRAVARILDDGAIDSVLQPIVDLQTGLTAGFEALARFPDTPGISPEVWFAEAESAGLGRQLEWAAARSALDQFAKLPEGAFLSINASPEVAVDRCLREMMRKLPKERLVIEMTEHAPIDDYERLNVKLERRRAEGVRLAVDDAGAGFASLRHLLGLRPSIIKLDISLVRAIDRDPLRQSLAASLVEFGRSAGAELLAEGVESQGELDEVRKLGIRFAQGFLLGRPAPATAI